MLIPKHTGVESPETPQSPISLLEEYVYIHTYIHIYIYTQLKPHEGSLHHL